MRVLDAFDPIVETAADCRVPKRVRGFITDERIALGFYASWSSNRLIVIETWLGVIRLDRALGSNDVCWENQIGSVDLSEENCRDGDNNARCGFQLCLSICRCWLEM